MRPTCWCRRTVSYNAATLTARLTPTAALAASHDLHRDGRGRHDRPAHQGRRRQCAGGRSTSGPSRPVAAGGCSCTGESDRRGELPSRAIRRASGTSAAPATRASRASPPTSASTAARRSPSRSTRPRRDYRLDIYRMGYYGGVGARKVATVQPSAALPQNQPACLNDATTGLIDCGNWAVSALLGGARRRASRASTSPSSCAPTHGGASHIVFVVRDDASHVRPPVPDLRHDLAGLQQLRRQQPLRRRAGRAAPTRSATTGRSTRAASTTGRTGSSTPSTRWSAGSRRNGYDVSYITGVDSRPRGARDPRTTRSSCRSATTSTGPAASAPTSRRRATPASTSRSSAATRSSGRRAGRPSIDGSGTPYRTLVCYKETHANAKIDPTAGAGPAPGATRASARRPTAAGRRTR